MNIYLESKTSKERLRIPLLPDKLSVNTGAYTIQLNIIKSGEVRIPRGAILTGYSWSGVFPGSSTSSFEAALVKAVNLGGDADTIGAITGGLAGALYGIGSIPMRWRSKLERQTDMRLNYLAGVASGRRSAMNEKRKVLA